MSQFTSPFMAKSPLNQTSIDPNQETKNAITGRTQSEQNAANVIEKKRQVNNPASHEAYQKARAAKKTWEDSSPDNFLKEYPNQKELDSLRKVYRSKKEQK